MSSSRGSSYPKGNPLHTHGDAPAPLQRRTYLSAYSTQTACPGPKQARSQELHRLVVTSMPDSVCARIRRIWLAPIAMGLCIQQPHTSTSFRCMCQAQSPAYAVPGHEHERLGLHVQLLGTGAITAHPGTALGRHCPGRTLGLWHPLRSERSQAPKRNVAHLLHGACQPGVAERQPLEQLYPHPLRLAALARNASRRATDLPGERRCAVFEAVRMHEQGAKCLYRPAAGATTQPRTVAGNTA